MALLILILIYIYSGMALLISIPIFSRMALSISIFSKSVDISTFDMAYRYIEHPNLTNNQNQTIGFGKIQMRHDVKRDQGQALTAMISSL